MKTAVYVEWEDSAYLSGWTHNASDGICLIRTIGWLIEEEDECIVVSAHDDDDTGCHSPMSIPWGCIRKYYEVCFK